MSFIVGMVAEMLGVNFGYIFGSYQYGEALGWKLFGVPLLLGANWTILTVCSAAIAAQLYDRIIPRIITNYWGYPDPQVRVCGVRVCIRPTMGNI